MFRNILPYIGLGIVKPYRDVLQIHASMDIYEDFWLGK